MKEFYENVKKDAEKLLVELLEVAGLRSGDILVVGCSTSEVAGGIIGKNSSADAADAIFDAFAPILREKGIFLAAHSSMAYAIVQV